ncbi:MAG: LCP family protein [Mobilitalea sp.]
MAQQKKKKRGKLLIILFFEILVIALLFIGLKIYSKVDKIQYNAKDDNKIKVSENVVAEGYRNIAIFGVDSRDNTIEESTHSDTIIIASINNKTKDVKLVSVYRDTYIDVGEGDYTKITAAYFQGGYSQALTALNTNFDLDIQEYVTVNFNAVIQTIDMLGGIEIDLQEEELEWLNVYIRELNRIFDTDVNQIYTTGPQTLNGTQATAYARIRHATGGDFKRTERQRLVIQKIFDKVKTSDLATVNNLIDEIFPQVYTNINSTELIGLATDVFSYNIVDQTGFPFENDAHTYDKVSYVFPIDLQSNVVTLHQFLFPDVLDYTPSTTVVERSDYIKDISSR